MKTPTARPIICGIDFSESAQHAARAARAIAARMRAPLLLVHSIDERGEIPDHLRAQLHGPARRALAQAAAQLRQEGVEVEEKLLEGVPHGIVACADTRHAMLIVLAASGTGALGRWVIGSVAERVAESATVPTLVVRNAALFEQWQGEGRPLKILVGVDFSPASDAALRWLAELKESGPCEIELAFIDRPGEERAEIAIYDALGLTHETPQAESVHQHDLLAKAERFLGDAAVKVRVQPGSARIDAHLIGLATAAHADLIVLGVRQRHGIFNVGHVSVSRRILHDARHNVLCVPIPKTAEHAAREVPKIQQVLVATDLSENGSRAVAFAHALLPAGGSLCALHVARPGEDVNDARARLRHSLPAHMAAIPIDLRVDTSDHPAAAICDAADRFNADVICVGSHGRSGVSGAILGSVAQSVIAHSTRPVLVVTRPVQ